MTNKKVEEKSFKDIIIGFIPAILLSVVIFPILAPPVALSRVMVNSSISSGIFWEDVTHAF